MLCSSTSPGTPRTADAPAGGFFDGKTTAAERQAYLLDTLRASAQQAQQAQRGGDGGQQLSDAQLNALLARGEGELQLFAAEDWRLRVSDERGSWAGAGAATAACIA